MTISICSHDSGINLPICKICNSSNNSNRQERISTWNRQCNSPSQHPRICYTNPKTSVYSLLLFLWIRTNNESHREIIGIEMIGFQGRTILGSKALKGLQGMLNTQEIIEIVEEVLVQNEVGKSILVVVEVTIGIINKLKHYIRVTFIWFFPLTFCLHQFKLLSILAIQIEGQTIHKNGAKIAL